jgi:hypothetical protein
MAYLSPRVVRVAPPRSDGREDVSESCVCVCVAYVPCFMRRSRVVVSFHFTAFVPDQPRTKSEEGRTTTAPVKSRHGFLRVRSLTRLTSPPVQPTHSTVSTNLINTQRPTHLRVYVQVHVHVRILAHPRSVTHFITTPPHPHPHQPT